VGHKKTTIVEYSSLEETIVLYEMNKKYYIDIEDGEKTELSFWTLDEAMRCFHQLTDDFIDH
jgi:hypothetical protein